MRTASQLIWDTWNAGAPLIGELKACSRVTVDVDWQLRTELSPGKWPADRCPVRWFQRFDNGQVEVEIPQVNILTVDIDRSIENDAAQCNIDLLNTLYEVNDAGPVRKTRSVYGEPGALTYDYGASSDAAARWGHTPNEWYQMLAPGAMLRTYQGFGGHDKPLDQAVADGNLLLTGVWIVDDVRPDSSGTLGVVARDTAALLLDQLASLPLLPKTWFPTRFYRWTYEFRTLTRPPPPPAPGSTIGGGADAIGVKRIRYEDSSADRWYGGPGVNAAIHGHRGSDSVDGNSSTFALSVGNSHPSRPYCCDWFQYLVGEELNAIWLVPWAGNYEVYISVMEDGRWVGDATVPYDYTPLIGQQPHVVDTGANIRYVTKGGIGWEQPTRFQLPRAYRADRIRISFRQHTLSEWGPWFYRCGIREINGEIHGVGSATAGGTATNILSRPPMWMDLAATHDGDGYYALHATGQIEEFGIAIKYGEPKGTPIAATKTFAQSMAVTAGDDGYWVLAGNGKVFTYGTATHHGDAPAGVGDAVALCITYTGAGYWIVTRSGRIFNFGDAPPYTRVTGQIGAAASHPTLYGLWLYDEVGPISVRGSAINYGSPPQTCPGLTGSGIVASPSGLGYYCVEEYGAITVFGDAVNLGATSGFLPPPYPSGSEPAAVEPRINAIALAPIQAGTVKGYATLAYDGRVFPQRDWPAYGQPAGEQAEIKRPGNYLDYADIVYTLLLWAGFWHQSNTPNMAVKPALFGNIETTGAYSDAPLTEDFFQNKPIIDIITALKEIVGYLFWVDDEGKSRFESPNFWQAGNFLDDVPDSPHTTEIPVIDERVNMTQYSAETTKRHSRSRITVGSEDPNDEPQPGLRSFTHIPEDTFLRGMQVPASMGMPVTGIPVQEMKILAQLIGLHIWFARRTGQVSCLANPAIGINDQVRILERTTSEVHIHYVRGIQSTHDLQSGEYSMNLTTHWLGDSDSWAIHVDQSDHNLKYITAPPPPILTVRPDIQQYELSAEAYERARSNRPQPIDDLPLVAGASSVVNIDEPVGAEGAAT